VRAYAKILFDVILRNRDLKEAIAEYGSAVTGVDIKELA